MLTQQVACKYLHDPILFERPGVGRVKFDVRYCVMVSSVQPLVVHTYNVFWLRFANLPFALERLVRILSLLYLFMRC